MIFNFYFKRNFCSVCWRVQSWISAGFRTMFTFTVFLVFFFSARLKNFSTRVGTSLYERITYWLTFWSVHIFSNKKAIYVRPGFKPMNFRSKLLHPTRLWHTAYLVRMIFHWNFNSKRVCSSTGRNKSSARPAVFVPFLFVSSAVLDSFCIIWWQNNVYLWLAQGVVQIPTALFYCDLSWVF